jgi:hypothetical protein
MIDGALLVWFEEQSAMNFYINGTIIKEKAEVICLRLSIHFMLQTVGSSIQESLYAGQLVEH